MGRLGTSEFKDFTRKDLLSCSINQLNNFLTINGKDSDLQGFKKKINSSLSNHEKEFIKSKSTELNSKLISIEGQYLDLLQDFYELYLKEDDLSKAWKYILEHTYNPTKKKVSFEKPDDDKVMQKVRDSYKDASKTLQMKKSMAIYEEIMETMQVKHDDVSQLDISTIIDTVKKSKDDISEYSDVEIFRRLYDGNLLLLKFREIIKNRREYDEISASLETPFMDFVPLLDINKSDQSCLPPPLDLSSIPLYDAELSSDGLVASPLSDKSKPAHRDTISEQYTRVSLGSQVKSKCPYGRHYKVLRPNLYTEGTTAMSGGRIKHDDSNVLNTMGGKRWEGPPFRLGVIKGSLDDTLHNPIELEKQESPSIFNTSNGKIDVRTGEMRYGIRTDHCTGRKNNVPREERRYIDSLGGGRHL